MPVSGGLRFTRLSGAYNGTCGIVMDGSVYCWWDDGASTLGNGETDDRRVPFPMLGGQRFLLYEPGTVSLMGLGARP